LEFRRVLFRSAYADSKRMAEEVARGLAREGLDVVSLLPGLLLGPGDPEAGSTRVVLYHLRRLLRGCPTGGIAFADVRDVADAYAAALALPASRPRRRDERRYILGGHNLGYAELGRALAELTGIAAPWPVPAP